MMIDQISLNENFKRNWKDTHKNNYFANIRKNPLNKRCIDK